MIKEVDFNGANLMAAQDNDGKVYVGVSYICNGIGLSKSQKDTQIQNMQKDYVLKRGCLKFQAGVFDPNNEALAVELEFLPLWLAKISITPKIVSENQELADKIADYQLKAKDVLAKAFLPNIDSFIQDYLDMDEDERGIAYFQEKKQRKLLEQQTQELIPKARSFEQLISAKNNQTMNDVAKAFKTGRNRLFAFLRNKGILMKDNCPYQQYIEQKLFVVREYTIPDADGELINRVQTLVTGKGIEFIDRLLKKIDYNVDLYLEQYGSVSDINPVLDNEVVLH